MTKTPGPFVKLDSDPEQNLADLLVGVGDRFYLLEAKSERGNFRSEWNTKKENNGGKKRVFNTLVLVAEDWDRSSADDDLDYTIAQSLACHHFIYWSEDGVSEDHKLGNMLVEPYLLGCWAKNAPGLPKRLSKICVVEKIPGEDGRAIHHERTNGSRQECLSLGALLERRGFITQVKSGSVSEEFHEIEAMGLELEPFKEYLEFLVRTGAGSGGDDSLNAVIFSDSGYLRRLNSFADLGRVLGPTVSSSAAVKRAAFARQNVDIVLKKTSETAADPRNSPSPKPRRP